MSDTKTPRTDAAVKETKALPDYEAWNESVNAVFARQLETELAARDTELKVLNETHGIQLAAILTACIQNTDASVRGRIGRDNPYWTVAYGDVCVAVDREMRERERAENAERELAAVTAERDRLREVFQVPATVTDPLFIMDGWRDQHSGALSRLGELERELAELRQRDTCGREELSDLRAKLAASETERERLNESLLKTQRLARDLREERDAARAAIRWAVDDLTDRIEGRVCFTEWVIRDNLRSSLPAPDCAGPVRYPVPGAPFDEPMEPVMECGTSDAEIYERIDMAETYPGSGVLNFGEVGLRTITDWCDLVRGTDYDCEKCDIESIMQTMQKWWRDKTTRAGWEKGGV